MNDRFARYVHADTFVRGLWWVWWSSGRVDADVDIGGEILSFDRLSKNDELELRRLLVEARNGPNPAGQ